MILIGRPRTAARPDAPVTRATGHTPSRMRRIVGSVWVPIVLVVALALTGFAVYRMRGVFGSQHWGADARNAGTIEQFNPKHILYEIYGAPGTVATINWLDTEAQPQHLDSALLPWSLNMATTLTAVVGSVIAQGDGESIGCRIIVNGVVRDEQIVNVDNAQVSCLVKSA